ncbi:hypothetical protein JD969_16125 [Planctomycetota bacterium]|nr:hypothetical protein JD969_16125 [Planctomycetota bacterium]
MDQKDFDFSKLALVGALVGSCFVGQSLQAEVGPGLLFKPWQEDVKLETQNSVYSIIGNETGQGEDFDMNYFVSSARMNMEQFGQANLNVGYKVTSIQIDTDQAGLPSSLNNIAAAVSYDFGEIADNWTLGYTLGMGTANDGHYDNSDSYYGMATVAGTYSFDAQRKLSFGLTYDGNRSAFPDAPLPFVQYFHYVSPELQYMLGLYSSVTWRPTEDIVISAGSGLFPGGQIIGADARASWYVTEQTELFISFDQMTEGFYQDDRDNRRLFFMYNMASIGTKFDVNEKMSIEGGVGYAFNQKLSEGFDTRTLDTIAKPDDHAVLFLNVKADF